MISLFLVTPVWVINCVLFFFFFVCVLVWGFLSLFIFIFYFLLFFLVCSSSELMVKHQSFLFLF